MNPTPNEPNIPNGQVPTSESSPVPSEQDIIPVAAAISHSFVQQEAPASQPTPEVTALALPGTEAPITPAPVEATPQVITAPVIPAQNGFNPFTAGEPIAAPAPGSAPTSAPVDLLAPIGSGVSVDTKPERIHLNKTVLVSIIGGALILIIVGIVLYFMLIHVTKQDYADAATQLDSLRTENSAYGDKLGTLTQSVGTSNSFDAAIKDVEDSSVSVAKLNHQLGAMKALRFGEGRKFYIAFDEKFTANTAYVSTLTASFKKFNPSAKICSGSFSSTDLSTYGTQIKACADSLKSVTGLPNAELQAYISSLAVSYEKLATLFSGVTGISSTADYTAIMAQMSDIGESVTTAQDTFTADIKKKAATDEVKTTSEALATYLDNQKK